MDTSERDHMPMLPVGYPQSDQQNDSRGRNFMERTMSALPMYSVDSSDNEYNLVGFTGPRRNSTIQMSGPLNANSNREFMFQPSQSSLRQKNTEPKVERYPSTNQDESNDGVFNSTGGENEHLLRSGQLEKCNDRYCTICLTYYGDQGQQKQSKTAELFDPKFLNAFYGDASSWAERKCSFMLPCIPRVMDPHEKIVQRWNKFFVISCLLAVFLDPLFFLLLHVDKDDKCIMLDMPMTKTTVIFRTMFDFIYLLHILLQFRLAYVSPESTVVGAGELVVDPKEIARNYLCGYFFIDLFIVLPLPQIIILVILPSSAGGANYAKNLLRAAILLQYLPRLFRFLPLAAGQSATGFTFESAWANFVINLLTFVLASHVIGSCWYLFGLQRVNHCFRDACRDSNITECKSFIDCGHGTIKDWQQENETNENWKLWKSNDNATACFGDGSFDFGIYKYAVNLTHKSLLERYIYSLFWGFQQISTLAGNQVPSYFVWEVLFTMAIIGIGLLLFALLIGNMQNFLQALGRRRLQISLRRWDAELWMNHRRLPDNLRRQVRDAERFNWAATRGVNEAILMENLPEDLQRAIRRHLFKVLKEVPIFRWLDDIVLDAIHERLRIKTYINGSTILSPGHLVDKMMFIIRGKLEIVGEDKHVRELSGGGYVLGEELLIWCLGHYSVNKDEKRRIPGQKLQISNTVRCTSNVEVFVLRIMDLEEVTSLYARFLKSSGVQYALRNMSSYWRSRAAKQIQAAWRRYRKERIAGAGSSSPPHD